MAYFGCGLKALFYKGLSEGIVRRIVPLTILPPLSLRGAKRRGNLYFPHRQPKTFLPKKKDF